MAKNTSSSVSSMAPESAVNYVTAESPRASIAFICGSFVVAAGALVLAFVVFHR